MIEIHSLTLADRSLINTYLQQYPPDISELTFTNLFMWQNSRPVWFVEIKNSLVFLIAEIEGQSTPKMILGEPVGNAALTEIFETLIDSVKGGVRVPVDAVKNIEQSGLDITLDRDNSDYVYLVSELADLSGRKFSKKRNHIKQCLKNYSCEYEPITEDNIKECIDFQNTWCQERDCEMHRSLCHEYNATCEMFKYFFEFDLIGGSIRVDGNIKAFAVAERLNNDTAVWHFEKAMPGINGLGQLINQWFSEHAISKYTYVNREQDLGVPGLRQAKESYFPHHMVEKYNIRLPGSLTESREITEQDTGLKIYTPPCAACEVK